MTVHSLDQLELSIKALSLTEKDVLVVTVQSEPTIAEMQGIQQALAHLFTNLDLGFSVSYIVMPRGLDMYKLDEEGMAQNGWVRAWKPLTDKERQ